MLGIILAAILLVGGTGASASTAGPVPPPDDTDARAHIIDIG